MKTISTVNRHWHPCTCILAGVLLLAGCGGSSSVSLNTNPPPATPPPSPTPTPPNNPPPDPVPIPNTNLDATEYARFEQPWAIEFLPDNQRMLVTEKGGTLKVFDLRSRSSTVVTGMPAVVNREQGGLGDVIVHPRHASNGLIYISYAEAGSDDTRGAAVARARLQLQADGSANLTDLMVIWRQFPKVTGYNHYSHRMVFSPDGRHLFISSGERQKFDPAQDMTSNLGKIVRLQDDGQPAADNPFSGQGEIASQVWTLGHRNVLGMAFDAGGRLWQHEMGPKGGDEFNLITRGRNYGWPLVSEGDHYDGTPIPRHSTRPDMQAPLTSWTPVIAPAGMIIYSGGMFPDWRGQALIGGLASQALVRVQIRSDNSASEAARYPMGQRIRDVDASSDGAVWVIEDGSNARLLKLTPRSS